MSLQSLWSLVSLDPARALNLLALFFCVAGGWLLVATRMREQGALAGFSGRSAADGGVQTLSCDEDRGATLNRFFYGFGGLSLLIGLGLSLVSRLI